MKDAQLYFPGGDPVALLYTLLEPHWIIQFGFKAQHAAPDIVSDIVPDAEFQAQLSAHLYPWAVASNIVSPVENRSPSRTYATSASFTSMLVDAIAMWEYGGQFATSASTSMKVELGTAGRDRRTHEGVSADAGMPWRLTCPPTCPEEMA